MLPIQISKIITAITQVISIRKKTKPCQTFFYFFTVKDKTEEKPHCCRNYHYCIQIPHCHFQNDSTDFTNIVKQYLNNISMKTKTPYLSIGCLKLEL